MAEARDTGSLFGTETIGRILWKTAPPVMLAQLIQALYNIVDSFFVGQYSASGLAALSIIFPIQFVVTALAVGTGVGVNTFMAREYALERPDKADKAGGAGMVLALLTWVSFALLSLWSLRPYVAISTRSPETLRDGMIYGAIVCVGSIGAFLEGCWSKVHQAQGNMRLPMAAQVAGAVANIVLDPLLIFGLGPFPSLGVAGAALATVAGQWLSALIVGPSGWRRPPAFRELRYYAGRIYFYGYSAILMQVMATAYIIVLNIILGTFSDAAVTVLGLYYKMQSFFFIPLLGLQTCIVPVISYNHARERYDRCRAVMRACIGISLAFMVLGIVCFLFFPDPIIGLFSQEPEVHAIGDVAFPIIGTSFFSAVFSLMLPVFFQSIGDGRTSLLLSMTRQIFCLMPSFWLFSRLGLDFAWCAFPFSETVAGGIGLVLYLRVMRRWKGMEQGRHR